MRRKKIYVACVFGLFIVFFSLFGLRKLIFQQCVEHVEHSSTHTHTMLTIIQEGREISIPSNMGITDECMHPLHTHDATGLIHMEYPAPFPFFLGDFFDVMGVTFNNTQIGAIRTFDGYAIRVTRNNKPVTGQYRWILLKDLDKLEIRVEKVK